LAMWSWSQRRMLGVGLVLMVVGLAVTSVGAWLPDPSIVSFLIGGAIAGSGAGAVFKGSIGLVIEISPVATRAEALAAIFLAGYLGLSVPAIGAGIALQHASARATLLGFAIAVTIGVVAAAPQLLKRPTAAQDVAG
jgi:MFS family permease